MGRAALLANTGRRTSTGGRCAKLRQSGKKSSTPSRAIWPLPAHREIHAQEWNRKIDRLGFWAGADLITLFADPGNYSGYGITTVDGLFNI